jgi:lysophospholipase L1-like esterase
MSISSKTQWVTAWGNAMSIAQRRPENYARNLTLRYPVKMLLSGTALRIRLDNFCGTEAVTITAANAARSIQGSTIAPETLVSFTFGGSPSVTIPAGAAVVSDPVPFSVATGDDIAISLYFAEFTEMRSAVLITGPLSGGFFAVGEHAQAATLPPEQSNKTNWFYFLSDIAVMTDGDSHAVICYGDSITAQGWPDFLMQRTLRIGDGTTSIVRKAASGTRILREYDNITYDSYGRKGSVRFPREALVSGADTVIIQHGINDIIHPVGTDVNPFRPWSDLPTADELIDGLRAYLATAKAYGLKTYLGTLLPIAGWRTYADFREQLRCDVNEWIRTTKEADGCIDFDRALCDPAHPAAFADGFDSGDHLHPSLAAYQRMAEIVPETLIRHA